FLFLAPAPTAPPPLSLHDALPIYAAPPRIARSAQRGRQLLRLGAQRARRRRFLDFVGKIRAGGDFRKHGVEAVAGRMHATRHRADRKSTRLNSSHVSISYAVFCLK